VKQIEALARFFKVSAAVFLDVRGKRRDADRPGEAIASLSAESAPPRFVRRFTSLSN
jgi:hypothetical protein